MLGPLSSLRRRGRILAAGLVGAGAIAAVLAVTLAAPSSRAAPHRLESMFQDDQYLLYSPTATVARTLDSLAALGVNRVRVTVLWLAIAPDPSSAVRPAGFDASNPAAYPPATWVPYDRVLELARARGIGVDFDITAPGPLWAMARGAPDLRSANHYQPSAQEFAQFVLALGRRYSGGYAPGSPAGGRSPIPRVDFWSIWNEPNQPGWLAPQWRTLPAGREMDSPRLYREYVDAAFAALAATGHRASTDAILVGELAPEGGAGYAAYNNPIPPIPFLRALYCVDARDHPLSGAQAAGLGCPVSGARGSFVAAHPGLFGATGFAHHPYSFFLAPDAPMADPNFVPLSELARLERALDRIFATHGVGRGLPLYLTEYGYETNPPNPYRGVAPTTQAQYLDEAEYMAWKDPRVRTLSQFLLFDSPPNRAYPPGSPGYWSTFQTGLLYADGTPKPSFHSYRLPIFIPDPVVARGAALTVWARLRPASGHLPQRVRIEWAQAKGAYRTLAIASTGDPGGVLIAHLHVPGPGRLRVGWTSPGGPVFFSRAAAVVIRG